MSQAKVAEKLRAFSPEDLLAAYHEGRRDFSRSNLLRAEIEASVPSTDALSCVEHPSTDRYNPLWVDFSSGIEQDFSWDVYGRCILMSDIPSVRSLSGAMLAGINFSGAYLYPVDFSNADLSRSDFRHAVFVDCVLSGASLARADLRDAQFLYCSLKGVEFYMARMDRVVVTECDASHSSFRRAKLRRSRLGGVDLRDSCLQDAHCEGIALAGDLRGIDLSTVRLPAARVGQSTISAEQVRPLLDALAIKVK